VGKPYAQKLQAFLPYRTKIVHKPIFKLIRLKKFTNNERVIILMLTSVNNGSLFQWYCQKQLYLTKWTMQSYILYVHRYTCH